MKKIRDLLSELTQTPPSGGLDVSGHVYAGLNDDEAREFEKRGASVYRGKVRDVIDLGKKLLIVHSDRLTAFDRYIGHVPYKGTILTEVSDFWLKEAQKVAPTHLIERPDERVLVVEKAAPVKAEVIVRGYLAGSMARAYKEGVRTFCGVTLPEGLKTNQVLPEPIITPTTKAEAFEHDVNTTPEALVKNGVVTEEEWKDISAKALNLFAHGQKVYQNHGWILVDTKYEFGRAPDGSIKVIDEVHTPDSSRLWVADSYAERVQAGESPEMLDKEIVRRYLLDQGFSGEGDVPKVPVERLVSLATVYLRVAETLAGEAVTTTGPGHRFDPSAYLT